MVEWLPQETLAVLHIPNTQELRACYADSNFGRMIRDPQVAPLVGAFYGKAIELTAALKEQVGASLEELLSLPQGEVITAIISEEAEPAWILAVDMHGRQAMIDAVLGKLESRLKADSVEIEQQTVEGITVRSFRPPHERQLFYYCVRNETLLVTTSLSSCKSLLAHWETGDDHALRLNSSYAAVVNACRHSREEHPQATIFTDPVNLTREYGRASVGAQMAMATFPALGLDGLKGVGGTLSFPGEELESLFQLHIATSDPRSGALDVPALRSSDFTPPKWVTRDTMVLRSIDNDYSASAERIMALVDLFRGAGFSKAAMDGGVNRELGVDFLKDIVGGLDGHTVMVQLYPAESETIEPATVFGIRLRDPQKFAKTLDAIKEHVGDPIERKQDVAYPFFQVRNGGCFAIAHDYILISSDAAVLKNMIEQGRNDEKLLAQSLDYKLIASKTKRLAGPRPLYGMFYQNGEATYKHFYNLAGNANVREQLRNGNEFQKGLATILDANQLPPWEALKKYLSSVGGTLLVDETGYHLIMFAIKRK